MSEKLVTELERQQRRFENWLSKHNLVDLNPITSQKVDLPILLSLCYEVRKDVLPLHAIWYLEKYIKVRREHLKEVIPSLLLHLNSLSHEGSERIAGNILLENFRNPVIYVLSDDEKEIVIETCFNWMISPIKPVAVVANGIEILYHLVDEQDWIKEELLAQITVLENRSSPALIARGRKIKQKLRKYTSTQRR